MTWLAPWAWAGLALLGLPIVIHLLGRGESRRHPFPTLRFIETSRLLPTRRTRIHDPLLLLLRLLILGAAVAALARPRLDTAARGRTLDGSLVRAIVVDTSASVRARGALDGALARADSLRATATVAVVLPTASPAEALPGAAAWLAGQSGRSEVVLLSDFQEGTLSAEDLTRMPADVGVTLLRLRATREPDGARSALVGDRLVTATAAAGTFTWRSAPSDATADDGMAITGDGDAALLDATRAASRSVALLLPRDSAHPVRLALGASATLPKSLRPPAEGWMLTLLDRLLDDPLLADLPEAAGTVPHDSLVTVLAGPDGAPTIRAAAFAGDGATTLLVVTPFEAGSVEATRIAAALRRARSLAAPPMEAEPAVVTDAVLAGWSRAVPERGTARDATSEEGGSDGRWLWGIALLLLLGETLLRRQMARREASDVVT